MKTYKIYLDSCCISRPYDNQTQSRIKSETAAIMQIISRFWSGEWLAITSKVLQFEINQISEERQQWVGMSDVETLVKRIQQAENDAECAAKTLKTIIQ